jgi:hypothetical protein
MWSLKTCRVSCIDLCGVEHAVEASASSLYEAVAQALRIFRDNEWIEGIGHGQTPISVRIKHPETEHTVSRSRLRALVASSPALTC